MMPRHCRKLATALFFVVFVIVTAVAQITQPSTAQEATKGAFLLTIFLKHDQSKPHEQINAQLRIRASSRSSRQTESKS